MNIKYNQNLKQLARKNRQSGNIAESKLWLELKGKKVHNLQFTRQRPIQNYILDFYCSRIKLAIEIDGSSHIDLTKDVNRQAEIEKLGIVFLRFNHSDVLNNMNEVVEKIKLVSSELLNFKNCNKP